MNKFDIVELDDTADKRSSRANRFCRPEVKMSANYENYLRGALTKVVFDRSVVGGATVNWISKLILTHLFIVYYSIEKNLLNEVEVKQRIDKY